MAPQYELPERDNLEGEGFPLKRTKAFERGLEGLEMAAPRTSRVWTREVSGLDSAQEKDLLICKTQDLICQTVSGLLRNLTP